MVKIKSPESFESAIVELEKIVEQIENDEISLESALEKYQHGTFLVKFCQDKLKEVEHKIKILDTEAGALKDFILE
ncbi:MAG TPA: exodeoxyribonuclease VII small subunit [Burkholderiales bacterium]|nr:exodeoxyribonuclease VII small subunit [Burkholderiales bacterium]